MSTEPATVTISAAEFAELIAARAERDALRRQLETTTSQRDDLQLQLYMQRLHEIEDSMYLHDLYRGSKRIASSLPDEITGAANTPIVATTFIKPGVVYYDAAGKNERKRRTWYRGRFETVNTIGERTHIYNIKACEKAVKDAFETNG
jgi:hypothetical protein